MTDPSDSAIRVFVYGTLKPGEANYQPYCAGKVTANRPACTIGQLFDLPLGYPAMTPGNGWVYGNLLEFDDGNVLAAIDALEGYDPQGPPQANDYLRLALQVYTPTGEPLGSAWGYMMSVEQAREWGGTLLRSGNWRAQA